MTCCQVGLWSLKPSLNCKPFLRQGMDYAVSERVYSSMAACSSGVLLGLRFTSSIEEQMQNCWKWVQKYLQSGMRCS